MVNAIFAKLRASAASVTPERQVDFAVGLLIVATADLN